MENSLKKLKKKIDLNFDETKEIFSNIMSGKASEQEMYDFLTFLSDKGEVSSEIAAGVHVLREKSSRVNVENAIDIPSFTPREASVLQLVAEGLMNKEIARKLETSIRNVEKYVSRLFIKTGTSSRTELVRYALENHLVT